MTPVRPSGLVRAMSKLALLGGSPVAAPPEPRWPIHDEQDRAALLRVLESRNWGGYPSPNVEASALAAEFAAAHDARFGVCAANGTVTLLLALRLLQEQAIVGG